MQRIRSSPGSRHDRLTPKANARHKSHEIKIYLRKTLCGAHALTSDSVWRQNWPIQPSKVDDHQVSQSTLRAELLAQTCTGTEVIAAFLCSVAAGSFCFSTCNCSRSRADWSGLGQSIHGGAPPTQPSTAVSAYLFDHIID